MITDRHKRSHDSLNSCTKQLKNRSQVWTWLIKVKIRGSVTIFVFLADSTLRYILRVFQVCIRPNSLSLFGEELWTKLDTIFANTNLLWSRRDISPFSRDCQLRPQVRPSSHQSLLLGWPVWACNIFFLCLLASVVLFPVSHVAGFLQRFFFLQTFMPVSRLLANLPTHGHSGSQHKVDLNSKRPHWWQTRPKC